MIEVRSKPNWSLQTNIAAHIYPPTQRALNICENQIYYLLGEPSQNIAMIRDNGDLVSLNVATTQT